MRYDAETDPDPEQWLALDEDERIDTVERYHSALRGPHPQAGSPRLHSAIHVTVESQVAAGDELPVRATLRRLRREGLTRHEAVHAIGQILVEHMYHLLQDASDRDHRDDPSPVYFAALESLTADNWRNQPPRPDEHSPRGRSKRIR